MPGGYACADFLIFDPRVFLSRENSTVSLCCVWMYNIQPLCFGLFSDRGICKGVDIKSAIKEIRLVHDLTRNKKCKLNLYLGVALDGLLALLAGVGVQAVVTRNTVSIFFSQCIFPATERLQAEVAVCVAAGHPAGALHGICKRWENRVIQCTTICLLKR